MSEQAQKAAGARRWLEPVTVGLTIVSIAVGIYFSIREQRTKELGVRQYATRPLMSLEERPAATFEIIHRGELVDSPWLVSARLENTGNQPIETRDIEKAVRLSFDAGKVLGVEIVQKSQDTIVATALQDENDVSIAHGLLNPGDWIDFDIIVDGEPDTPSISARISGVTQPTLEILSSGDGRPLLTVVPLPLPILYVCLALASLTGLLLTGAGLALLVGAIRGAFPTNDKDVAEKDSPNEPDFPSERILPHLRPSGRDASVVFAALHRTPTAEWMDNPESLATVLEKEVPEALFSSLDLDAQQATVILRDELRRALKEALAGELEFSTPRPDEESGDAMRSFDETSASTAELFREARGLAEARRDLAASSADARPSIDTEDLVGGTVVLAFGLALLLLLGGTWRMALGV